VTSSKLLSAVGVALYGEQWQAPLARALGVNRKNIQRWASGQYEPALGIWADLAAIVDARRQALTKLATPLSEAATGVK